VKYGYVTVEGPHDLAFVAVHDFLALLLEFPTRP
jgi:hypothetical protein